MSAKLENFTDVLSDADEICDSQPLSLSSHEDSERHSKIVVKVATDPIAGYSGSHSIRRPIKGTGQYGEFRSVDEIDVKYRNVFSYPFFNLVQSRVIDDALYSDKSMVVCAPTGSGKTVVFEMAIVHLLMQLEDINVNQDFKIIYMAPVKALCTERLMEWYPKFTKLGLLCIEVTGDTEVDFSQLKPYRIIITTPEKWDMLTRRWRDHRQLVEVIKLFLIDEVHILNDETRGPVLEAVVSRMKTIETSVQSTHRIEQLQQQYQGTAVTNNVSPSIRFVAVSATVSNPEDVAAWLGTPSKPAVYYKFGDECRPVKLRRIVEGYPCAEGTSIFKFDLVLNYKLWPIIQKYHNGKPTLIFCNTRKSVAMTAETLSREITISFNEEQKARLVRLASTIKNKKLQTLVLSGVGCHHAGLLYEERSNIEQAFRNRDLPILITTTTLAMGVNLPAHLVIIKNTQQYVSGAYQEYSISTVLQMVGRAGRPQFDTEATAVIMTRLTDKARYQALVCGSDPLQSYLHKRLPENLNSEAALGTVNDVAQCVQWLRSTFLSVRAAKDPKRYLGLPLTAPHHQISKKIEELCVKAMNGLASTGLITMDEACCIESTEAGRLMSIYYLDLETMKHIMKIDGSETLERLLWVVCESHELSEMHLRMDERRCLNALNRNNAASTIRFPMKGKITTRQMKLNCVIQAILGCLPIPDPSLNQEATKIMRIADRVCKCLVAYVTRPALVSQKPKYYTAVLNAILLAKCVAANLWENSPFVSKQLKGIGPTFSTLLATAGKANFMLLEESHPRDLERIMNKGPPAGNILRKQISLFPKYHLTMTPIDEKVVSIQLVLLNHHNLSENMEHLTAGTAHKSYIIIGDSENFLLLLTSFSDKDLIGVYDGSMTYQILRKHSFEHKIYAHCVSSAFAGIDAQCEYVFKDVESQVYPQTNCNEDLRKPAKKQTTITDTFRERKRKNTDEITQCKEKKKRESVLYEKFKNLKDTFGKTSKVLKDDLDKSAVMSEKILQELTHLEKPNISRASAMTGQNYEQPQIKSTFFEEETTYEINDDDFINDEFMDEDKINDILTEIEYEISKESSKSEDRDKNKSSAAMDKDCTTQTSVMPRPVNMKSIPSGNSYTQLQNSKAMNNVRKRFNKTVPKKTNYNFIDLLENNVDLSDTEDTTAHEQNSFTEAIRSHIEKYLQKAKTSTKPQEIILDFQDDPVLSKETEPVVIVQDSNIIGKDDDIDALDKVMQLKASPENITVTDGDKEPPVDDISKQFSVLDQKINSIDLTTDEFPSMDRHIIRDIGEENEFPSVELHRKINDVIAIENEMERTNSGLIPQNSNSEHITNSNKNIKSEKPESEPVIIEPKKAVNKLNTEKDLKGIELVLNAGAFDFSLEANKSNIDKDSTYSNIKAIAMLKEKQKLAEIEPPSLVDPKQIDIEQKEKENREVMAYNNHPPVDQTAFQLHDKELHIALPSPSYGEGAKKKPLESDKNKEERTTYHNPTAFNIDKEKVFTKINDDSKELKVALQNITNRCPEKHNFTEKELSKNKAIGFIPPYKRPTCGSYKHILPATSQRATTLEKQSLLEIEPPNSSVEEKREVTLLGIATCAFSNQPICAQQNISHILPNALSNTVSLFPALKEKPELLAIEQPKNSITESKDVTIYDNHNIMPDTIENYQVCTQLHYSNDKVPKEFPSTINLTSNLQEKQRPLENRQAFTQLDNGSSYTLTYNQNHYLNKYSFLSNKTDISTQETADHVVRVIRNLRIDLDITEIVSEERKSMEYNTGEVDKEETDDSLKDLNGSFKKSKLTSAPSLQVQQSEFFYPNSSDFSKDSKQSLNAKCNLKALPYSDNLTPVQNSSNNLPSTETKQLHKSDKKQEEWTKEDRKCDEEVKDKNTFSKYKTEDALIERKPNNVMSILQKYSNIMRKNTENADSLIQTKSNEKTTSAANKDKPKRPFKISDIDHLNPAPLPGVLIEKSKPVNVTQCFNLLEPNDKHAQLEQNKQQNICDLLRTTPKETAIEHEHSDDSHEADFSYCDLPLSNIEDDLEVKDAVSNIDQNMFDPKALLQCFSKDETGDIVPPPLEFSDYLNKTLDDETVPMDCYEPMEWEEKIDVTRDSFHSGINFKDNSQNVQSPSIETETWKLSRDEGSYKMYALPGFSPYSFTITRRNKEQTNPNALDSLLQDTTVPRQYKLKQFKFNHKSKYKL